ncbi:hypothetical protein [Adhaeribacter pallidiroseus]|uniref:PAS domain-containing protein n=1 Tax=Adhaeribacter pallidiroseus TaxID=2072847 RepID=A0A369Q6T4_9BACT|nr:hypothetical protein [Adhaeribacter pallidiroseus]RDC58846.1 hypothetical protein AHMF7616_05280 [Adhaeribacter pallidiroseus]
MVQERETFYQVFASTPAAISINRGPEHRFEYFNAAFQQIFTGGRYSDYPSPKLYPKQRPAASWRFWIRSTKQVKLTWS